MKNLKYYKIFESLEEEEEFSSIQSFCFTQTKEDIEDLFINLIDHNFEIDIKSAIAHEDFHTFNLADGGYDDFENKFYYGPRHVLEGLVNGEIFGCYLIKITQPNIKELTTGDLSRWALLFSELKRISSKFKYFSCNIINEHSYFGTGNSRVEIKILMEPIKDKVKLKSFLDKILNAEIVSNKYGSYSSVIKSIKSVLTPSMKVISYPKRIDDKIYFIFKPVSKQVLSLNLKKLQSVFRYNIKSIKLSDTDELLKGVLKEEVPDFLKPVIIIEAELDLKGIDTKSLQSNNIEFVKNLIKKVK